MRSSRECERMLTASVLAIGIALGFATTASAEPDDPLPAPVPTPEVSAADPAMPAPDAAAADGGDPAATACAQFASALDYASSNYSDFADALADPSMGEDWNTSTNVTGRTALRQAASAAMTASTTPGLGPEISAPMQSWSVNATKLLILMGVRAPVDPVNGKATDLNNDAQNVQLACAAAGTHA
jgi:hypothetical protein